MMLTQFIPEYVAGTRLLFAEYEVSAVRYEWDGQVVEAAVKTGY